MRTKQARAKTESKHGLEVAAMSLALVAGAFLVIGGAPAKSATFSIKAAKPAAARLASATPEAVSPREAIADRDTLDLQLD